MSNMAYMSAGMYTVMVAAMGRRVVAVDPILSNLALINSSLKLAGRSQLVSFINNPISDTVATLYPVTIHRANEGHTKLLPAPLLTPALMAAISGEAVTSVTLDQLISFTQAKTVIIKLDVEVSLNSAAYYNQMSSNPCLPPGFRVQGSEAISIQEGQNCVYSIHFHGVGSDQGQSGQQLP